MSWLATKPSWLTARQDERIAAELEALPNGTVFGWVRYAEGIQLEIKYDADEETRGRRPEFRTIQVGPRGGYKLLEDSVTRRRRSRERRERALRRAEERAAREPGIGLVHGKDGKLYMRFGRWAPLEHTGDSANIAYYRERGAEPGHKYLWCHVLRSTPMERGEDGGIRFLPGPPTYYVTVYRETVGVVAEFKYKPQRNPADCRLSTRTLARLLRENVPAEVLA